MQMQFRALLLSSAMLAATWAIPSFGQTFGEVTGRISDPTGAAIPAAQITLTSVATNAVRTTVSTDSGDYTFPAVAPGSYSVKVEKTAFKSATSTNVQVQVQQTVRLDFTLQVGQVSESIEVSASAQMLQAENVSLGTVIENKEVTELPLNGRNYLGLVALASNTNTLSPRFGQAAGRQGGDRANQSISVGGNRIMFDYFTLDGVTNTDPDFSTYVVLPSIDAIQEFKVQTGIYPAEFGHQSTQINVLTKSGGNAYHGSLFEFVRNDKFDAVPYAFTATHPASRPSNGTTTALKSMARCAFRNSSTAATGCSSWRMTNGKSSARIRRPPIPFRQPAMFGGDFSGLGTTIYDPDQPPRTAELRRRFPAT